EQSATTTKTMSATAFLRGAGNWTAYFNLGAPWLSAGRARASSPLAIAASAVAAAAALYGLARRHMPQRPRLCLSARPAPHAPPGVQGGAGCAGGRVRAPVERPRSAPPARSPGLYKLEPVIAVALTLGIAHVLGRARQQTLGRRCPSRRVVASIVLAPVVAACLAGLGLPYLAGQILQPGSFTRIPAYWSSVASFLASHSPHQTALIIPADSHGLYLWCDPIDDPLEPLATSPWAQRPQVPYGGAGARVFLESAAHAFESGQQVAGLAAFLQRAGVRYVVVRNDLNPTVL